MYVSYFYSRSNIALSTPITILRTGIYFITTLLYLPFIEFFASTWDCQSDGYHTLFPGELLCWSGIHIVLIVSAVLILMIFISISGFLTVTFYECR